jgi:hypothetical protein
LSAAELQRLEDTLFDTLLDNHPNCDRGLDRLLDDLTLADDRGQLPARPATRLTPEFNPAALLRIEEMLVGAVLDSHPRRDAALDRILDDLCAAEDREEQERAAFDAAYDNDFDGLG